MKTKTIDVWVSLDKEYQGNYSSLETHCFNTKATLTYEIEEPKVEITPSQLKEAYYKMPGLDDYDSLEKEIFGGLDE